MPAVIYARKSTDRDDRQVQSLDDQVRVLLELARREGIAVLETVTESRSAKEPGARPEFQRIISRIGKGEIDAILTWSMNRLSRNLVDGGIVAHLLQAGKLKSIRTPERTYLPDDNVLLLSVENGMATGYLQDLSRNVRRGMRGKAERGWRPGKVPVGYLNNPVTREIDIDPVRFPLVKKAWELFLTGSYTPLEVHRETTRLGLLRPDGKPYGRVLMYALLRNPFYAGQLRYDGRSMRAGHVPMISQSQFERAQAVLGRMPDRRAVVHRHAFAGVFRCGVCGCSVVGETKTKVFAQSGRTATYTYYHCSGSKGCPKRGISETTIRDVVLGAAARVSISQEFGQWARSSLRECAVSDDVGSAVSASQLDKAESLARSRLKRAKGLLLDGELSAADFREIRTEIEADLSQLAEQAAALSARTQQIEQIIESSLDTAILASEATSLGVEELRTLAVALGEERLLTLGKLQIRVDPILKEIAAFEPLVLSSQSYENGCIPPSVSNWSAFADRIRNVARMQLRAKSTDNGRSPAFDA